MQVARQQWPIGRPAGDRQTDVGSLKVTLVFHCVARSGFRNPVTSKDPTSVWTSPAPLRHSSIQSTLAGGTKPFRPL